MDVLLVVYWIYPETRDCVELALTDANAPPIAMRAASILNTAAFVFMTFGWMVGWRYMQMSENRSCSIYRVLDIL